MDENLDRLYLSITNKCNLRCRHCYRKAESSYENELRLEEIENILISAKDVLRSNQVSITGGEPFVREDLFDILDLTQKYKYNVDLSTNGLLLDKSMIDKLNDYPNVFYLQISVDGINTDSYEFVRGKDTFELLKKNLSYLSKSDFINMIDLMMIFLVTPRNIDEIEHIPEFAEKNKFDKVAIGEVLPFGNGNINYDVLGIKTLYNDVFEKIKRAREMTDIPILNQLHFSFLLNEDNPTPCTAKQGKILVIEPSGEILLCPYDTTISIGNIRDFNYRVDLAYEQIKRRRVELFDFVGNVDCVYYEKCQGGCPLLIKKGKGACDYRCNYKTKLF